MASITTRDVPEFTPQRDAVELLDSLLSEDDDYDERVWPALEEELRDASARFGEGAPTRSS